MNLKSRRKIIEKCFFNVAINGRQARRRERVAESSFLNCFSCSHSPTIDEASFSLHLIARLEMKILRRVQHDADGAS